MKNTRITKRRQKSPSVDFQGQVAVSRSAEQTWQSDRNLSLQPADIPQPELQPAKDTLSLEERRVQARSVLTAALSAKAHNIIELRKALQHAEAADLPQSEVQPSKASAFGVGARKCKLGRCIDIHYVGGVVATEDERVYRTQRARPSQRQASLAHR